jgi:hypothetical protein
MQKAKIKKRYKPSKRAKNDEPARASKVSEASQWQLALIASNLIGELVEQDDFDEDRFSGILDAALNHAFELWTRAGALLEKKMEVANSEDSPDVQGQTTYARNFIQKHLRFPSNYPARFRDFERLIIKASKKETSEARFRDYLRQRTDPFDDMRVPSEITVDEEIKRYQQSGIPDELHWKILAEAYLEWWSSQKSLKTAISARMRKKLEE